MLHTALGTVRMGEWRMTAGMWFSRRGTSLQAGVSIAMGRRVVRVCRCNTCCTTVKPGSCGSSMCAERRWVALRARPCLQHAVATVRAVLPCGLLRSAGIVLEMCWRPSVSLNPCVAWHRCRSSARGSLVAWAWRLGTLKKR